MRFYLSSYGLGNKSDKFFSLMPKNKKIGYIPNALDFSYKDLQEKKDSISRNLKELKKLGLNAELLDLTHYFGESDKLQRKLSDLGGVWVSGGNTFVLRQAMKLSGFDNLITELKNANSDFLYAGYSAGICVLAPNLNALQQVDDSTQTPYDELKEVIFSGLGFFDYVILPHYKSDHFESEDIDKEVEYCKKNKIPYKTLRDGEVIIIS